MFSNYIKLAWRVLGRRKFFTFISLFGISFTLGILMVMLSFLQSELGNDAPLTHKEDLVLLELLRLQRVFTDTVAVIDTVMQDGMTIYDTTYEYKSRGSMNWNSEMNNGIAEEYLSDLPSVEEMTILSPYGEHDLYVNGVKVTLSTLYCDASYWSIFDHTMLEGRTFDQTDMDQAAKVVVISSKAAKEYFGQETGVVDQDMLIDGHNYKVIGVFKHVGKIIPFVSPDAAIPYSNMTLSNQPSFYHGYFAVIFKKKPEVKIQHVKDDVDHAATLIPLDHPSNEDGFNEVILNANTYNEMYAQGVYYDRDASKSLSIMKWVLLLLLLFFILLPTLNLINLNVSRIMDRSSEIGVRKAFGAHQGNILSQFIIENVVQTFLGGLIGLGLALALIQMINQGGYLGSAFLSLSPKFFLYSFLVTLLFGVLSGILPAWRMSKLQIVNAIKENKL